MNEHVEVLRVMRKQAAEWGETPRVAALDAAIAALKAFDAEPDADLELIWHSVSDNAETNAAYRRLKARLAALKAEKPTADEVLIAVKRDEGYEDVHPELVAEDFVSNPSAWCYRVLTPAVCAQMTSATPPAGDGARVRAEGDQS